MTAPARFDDQLLAAELADLLDFVADFLAKAEGPLLRMDFADFTSSGYDLDELRAALRRFAGWLAGEGFA
ncbi:MAG TPA: hypothetical protein VM242_04890 [Acidimicrobiales bacterium]|jgi:hypothetical protein|nr:hypothetical protein [Acidimicrobiales bacterium]